MVFDIFTYAIFHICRRCGSMVLLRCAPTSIPPPPRRTGPLDPCLLVIGSSSHSDFTSLSFDIDSSFRAQDSRNYDARMLLPNRQLTHETEMHQPFARTALGIAVAHVPTGRFESGLGERARFFAIFRYGPVSRSAGVELLALGREIVFFMANHGGGVKGSCGIVVVPW